MTREIYRNSLCSARELEGVRVEGPCALSWPLGRMRLESASTPEAGQAANFVLWFPEPLPGDFIVQWLFWPLREPGLAMVFFGARGHCGEPLFDPGLRPRSGQYDHYRYGDIDTLHLSYFRRSNPKERALQTVNLRKSAGFHLVAQGADPIPSVAAATPPYRLRLAHVDGEVTFSVNGLQVLHWQDDGVTWGRRLGAGWVGLRQMAPLIAEYSDLKVITP